MTSRVMIPWLFAQARAWDRRKGESVAANQPSRRPRERRPV